MTEQAQRAYAAWVSEQTYPQYATPANLLDQQQQRAWGAVAKALRCDAASPSESSGVLKHGNDLIREKMRFAVEGLFDPGDAWELERFFAQMEADAAGLRESNELLKGYIEDLREALIQIVGLLPAGTVGFCSAVNDARKVLEKGQK